MGYEIGPKITDFLPIFASRDLASSRLGDDRAGNLLPQHLEAHIDLAHPHALPLVGRLSPVLAHGRGLGPEFRNRLFLLPWNTYCITPNILVSN